MFTHWQFVHLRLFRKPSRLHVQQFRRRRCQPAIVESAWVGYGVFIPASSAIELLVAVDRIECDASDVTAFVASEDGPDSTAEEAAAVQAVLTALMAWLAELSPGSVGLLSIG